MDISVVLKRVISRNPSWADVEKLLGSKWSVLGEGKRSLALPEIDLSEVVLRTVVRPKEQRIRGSERRVRLMLDGDILLGASTFFSLKGNEEKIPESWRSYKRIYFDGSLVSGPPGGTHYVLYIEYDGSSLRKGVEPLNDYSYANAASATLPWNYRQG